jgi:hypothetical protein
VRRENRGKRKRQVEDSAGNRVCDSLVRGGLETHRASDVLAYGGIDVEVVKGDGRRPDEVYKRHFDIILFSPPYLNNIDYTEVYKIGLCAGIRRDPHFRLLS